METIWFSGSLCCVVVNMLECIIVESKFKIQLCYYVHFQTNTLWPPQLYIK